jgi:hypothetical protein
MTERDRTGSLRVDLKDGGGGGRRDYGPKGVCGPMVYGAFAASAVLLHLLLKAGAR